MSKGRAEQLVVISLFVFMASVIGSHLEGGDTSKKAKGHLTKHITGGFLTFLFAGLTAEVAPEVGAGLAIAVTVNAFFKYGLPAINSRFQKNEPSPKGVKGSSGPKPGGGGPTVEVLPGLGFEVNAAPNSQSSPMAI